MSEEQPGPDVAAERTALWRALYVLADPPPHVLDDTLGLRLVAPKEGWRERPDMGEATRGARLSIVARTRFMEDLVAEQARLGVRQYVILGAGLDTFAQRRPDIASGMLVFEADQAGPQAWKRQRLAELGIATPTWLRFVAANFETDDWWQHLEAAGFDPRQPAVVSSSGVSLYLTQEAIAAALRELATLAPGSTFAMTYLLPLGLIDPEDRPLWEMSEQGARRSGTPFLSFFAPEDLLALARECGFRAARDGSTQMLTERYFSNRSDGLHPASGEHILVATT